MTVPVLENQHQETVRENFRAGAKFNKAYLLMNVLAATIASYGLFANSPAVVIGAMIIAMLLGPIAGIALALVDGDMQFLLKSLITLLAGTGIGKHMRQQPTHTSLFILIFKRLVKDLFLSFEIYLLELSRSVYHA